MLPLNSSVPVRSILFMSFIVPIFAWNAPLISLIFLKNSPVFLILLFSSICLHWSLRFVCIANIWWVIEKTRELQKNSTSILLSMSLPLIVWITTNGGKFFKRWEYQTTLPASWEICMQVKKQHLELDMKQLIDSKRGKQYVKALYCQPAYLTYMQSISWEVLGWIKYKLESRLPGEISITSDMQMTPPLWQRVKN